MFMIIAIAALSVVGFVATIVALSKDGYRRIPTDPSRLP